MFGITPTGLVCRNIRVAAFVERHGLRGVDARRGARALTLHNRVNSLQPLLAAVACDLACLGKTYRPKRAEAHIPGSAAQLESENPTLASVGAYLQIKTAAISVEAGRFGVGNCHCRKLADDLG